VVVENTTKEIIQVSRSDLSSCHFSNSLYSINIAHQGFAM